jgi:hypothetical protein
MKTRKTMFGIFTAMALAIVTLGFIACDNGDEETTTEPVPKTYTITLKDGDLVFTVEYKALATDEPPYLAYLKTRLEVVVNSTGEASIEATEYLMTQGSHFTINMEYTGNSFPGINWDTSTQSFKVHNDWISTASGTDLSAEMIRTAFEAVGYEQ